MLLPQMILNLQFLYYFTCHSYIIRISFICTHMSLVCHSYNLVYHSYIIRMSLVCTLMSFVCHSYVLVSHSYVTCMYSYVIRMSLVCTHMSSVCHSYALICHPYVTRMWFYHESDICPNLFKNVNFLTRPLRRKRLQAEINSTEAYSVPGQTPKIIFTKTINT